MGDKIDYKSSMIKKKEALKYCREYKKKSRRLSELEPKAVSKQLAKSPLNLYQQRSKSLLNSIDEVFETTELTEDKDELKRRFQKQSNKYNINNQSFDSCNTVDFITEERNVRVFINKKGNYEIFYC